MTAGVLPQADHVTALPRVSSTLAVTALILVSLTPSLLPRSAAAQAVFTGLLAASGLTVVVLLRRLRLPLAHTPAHRLSREPLRILTLFGALVLGAWAIVAADHWQDSLRAAMGMPDVGPVHWIQVIVGATVTFAILIGIGVALRRVARLLGRIGGTTTLVLLAATLRLVVGPAVWELMSERYSDSDAVIEVSTRRPVATERSGGPDSVVSWESLGRQGRRFVASGDGAGSIRTYVGTNSASDTESLAALAVSELERAGGFDRSAIVITVPTGSGWIDENAAEGFEERFAGDVAIVGVQYSYLPSWMTFVFRRSAADESAVAVVGAITDHIATMTEHHRPSVYIYGQSLGSVGGSALFDRPGRAGEHLCGALWAGPPAGSVHLDGATVLANTSDPVVWWSPDLILHRPDLAHAVRDAPVPQWIPGITFLQTTVDLVSALNFSPGHGHRYGTEQGTALPACRKTPVPDGMARPAPAKRSPRLRTTRVTRPGRVQLRTPHPRDTDAHRPMPEP